ncbi:hypothetical protein BDV28DRAFT_2485 [Aspergillus coremiiformis]|uniref:Uncharacterized protein n=1 Tax=Aspergillus coremiiformis TaxID=138285 RepID=A0A5N6ZGQ9_9EURO|nr:hypothetical protein BDV28DRAFT_2485 [Aspergillus coremiiformis]
MTTEHDTQLRDAVTKEFAAAGYPPKLIESVLARQEQLKRDGEKTMPWVKIHRKDLLPDTLIAYKLPWEWDEDDSNYLIIKEWIGEDFQQELFGHTRRLRDRKLREIGNKMNDYVDRRDYHSRRRTRLNRRLDYDYTGTRDIVYYRNLANGQT